MDLNALWQHQPKPGLEMHTQYFAYTSGSWTHKHSCTSGSTRRKQAKQALRKSSVLPFWRPLPTSSPFSSSVSLSCRRSVAKNRPGCCRKCWCCFSYRARPAISAILGFYCKRQIMWPSGKRHLTVRWQFRETTYLRLVLSLSIVFICKRFKLQTNTHACTYQF